MTGQGPVPKAESGESGLLGHDDQPYFLCPTTRSCSIGLLSISATFEISCPLRFVSMFATVLGGCITCAMITL